MTSDEQALKSALLQATGAVTAALISTHKLPATQVEEVASTVYRALERIQGVHLSGQSHSSQVDIDASITPEYLVCLEDGKKLKMLKRYLKTNYNLTPEEYRKRWNLPPDYPMVAPNYAKRRSELAKDIGLGKQSIRQRRQNALGKFRSGLPAGKGKLHIVRSTDILMTRSPSGH